MKYFLQFLRPISGHIGLHESTYGCRSYQLGVRNYISFNVLLKVCPSYTVAFD